MTSPGRDSSSRPLRIATRGSPLALAQARSVAERLGARRPGPTVQLVVVRTAGDAAAEAPLERIGGQGAFVKEVQQAVLDGRADLAVHSAKDLPSLTPDGLVLACVPERADPRDALVGSTLAALGTGATVATGSVRRRAQLAWARPDLTFCELRGNIHTRIERARAAGAGVVAFAALVRLGLQGEADEVLDPSTLLPQVGQGALAVECRRHDEELLEALAEIDDPAAHRALRAERGFLGALGGGCTVPLGALASAAGAAGPVHLEAMLASADGRVLLRASGEGEDPEQLGAALAGELLDGAGGRAVLGWVP
jgi:hydroxymethylbilane synthase